MRALVAGWKERGLRGVGALAADLVVEVVPRPRAAALAWVPPDRERSLKRGYSSAERLARELGARWEIEPRLLVARARAAPPQRGLTRAARRRNVAGAFSATGRVPAAVCLVDDVYTTGATVSAAASALRAGGARRVEVVSFARALRSLDCG